MEHAWILGVLDDLIAAAEAAGLPAIADSLRQSRRIAAAELAIRAETGAGHRKPARLRLVR